MYAFLATQPSVKRFEMQLPSENTLAHQPIFHFNDNQLQRIFIIEESPERYLSFFQQVHRLVNRSDPVQMDLRFLRQ